MAGPISIVRPSEALAAAAGPTLLAFIGEDGSPREWRLVSGGAVVGRGDDLDELPDQQPWVRTALAVPGTDVTMRWLELAEASTMAQAAAAARLQIAEETLAPIGDMHVAAGRRESGLTAVATAPAARVQAWIEQAQVAGMDPDVIIPAPLLLMPPGEGLVRYDGGTGAADYRGTARAFSLEDALAEVVLGGEPVRDVGDDVREAGLGPALAAPAVNLRQGPFARRREVKLDRRRITWLATLGIILLTLSLLIQINAVARLTFAADRFKAEADELRAAIGNGGVRPAARGGFASAAGALFDGVRDTANASVTQIAYQQDGSLRASVLADSPATIEALRARIEGRGFNAVGGAPSTLGGRAAADLTLRPR